MPSAHRNALKKLLASIENRIQQSESRLIAVTDDVERTQLVSELADLYVRHEELMDALMGDGGSE